MAQGRSKRGFAAMDRQKQREIASKGGEARGARAQDSGPERGGARRAG